MTLPSGIARALPAPTWARPLVSLLLLATPAWAAETNLVTQRGQVSVGTFTNTSTLNARLDATNGSVGTDLDWGQEFGNQDVTRFRVDGLWRFSPRHHLRLMYTDYLLDRTTRSSTTIQWGDDTIPIDATLRGRLGFEIYEAAYEYAFSRSDRHELAASIGVHYTSFQARLAATLTGPGGSATASLGDAAAVDAPLPVVGFRGLWRLGGDFYLDAQAQYFKLSIDQIDGTLLNYRAAAIWQPWPRLGVGLGYDSFEVEAELTDSGFTGRLDWKYRGPQLFLNVTF